MSFIQLMSTNIQKSECEWKSACKQEKSSGPGDGSLET